MHRGTKLISRRRRVTGPAFTLLLILGATMVVQSNSALAGRFSFDMYFGQPLNFSGPLEIRQEGQETLDLTAEWESEPFDFPPYWDARLTYWTSPVRGWALDFFHHKIYLENKPAEVQNFEHSDGYNMWTVQRLWKVSDFVVMVGGGLVVTNPESTIRGRKFSGEESFLGGNYHMSGPVVTAGVGRRFYLVPKFFGSLEGRLTLSRATSPIVDGDATLTHAALHCMFGIGYDF